MLYSVVSVCLSSVMYVLWLNGACYRKTVDYSKVDYTAARCWQGHPVIFCMGNQSINQSLLLLGVAYMTRSQAVARIADRTASQHRRGSRDVIGHVTI